MSSLNYQQVSNSLIQNLSTQLARRTQGVALETLKQHHPKLAHALAQYSNSDLGVYYRTVGNARKECALLRFGHAKSLSGTLLTATDIKQPLYMPRYTSAIGFLITDPTKIHSIHDKLLLNPPANQTPEQIIEKRCSIVKALKAGNLQNRLSSIMIHGGPPRQDAVNESVINYEKTKIAAIIIPERTFNRSHGLNHLAKANTFTNNHCNALEEGRITAQLSYVTSKLGDLPILTFDGSQFKNLSLSI